ncbi:MAG: O-antigen ligase family protein [Patescibacteria group bacterium]|nr:O-antigen ligase family protein [Patescibacteria group bacterium]
MNILKIGVYLSFLSVFLVFTNLLFPYITSKQIFFNILVEILMVFWLALIIKYPEVRPFGKFRGEPKKSLITYGLAAFFAALLVSTIFSVDFNLSFWGDIERMLGWFHVVHFFLYYLVIITVFRGSKDWRNLFIVSIAAAVLVSFYSLFKTPYSTIGNTAYVSGYVIFNLYFALILFFSLPLRPAWPASKQAGRYGEAQNKGGAWLIGAPYLIVVFIMLSVLKVTHTRGAYVGLGVSFILFFILFAFYSKSKKVKIYSVLSLAAIVAVAGLVFMFPQSKIAANTPVLNTITQISSKASTFQTRLISWKAALKDLPSHIFWGTGYGNFAITFDKYFDPKFYSYTPTETYFDRAHNNLVDIASTAGLMSLLAYFSIFTAAGYYLVKGKKQNKISVNEFILLICVLVAYFIQNLAVFDSLVTYISLMLTLGYIYWLMNRDEAEAAEADAAGGLTNKELAVLVITGLVALAIVYQYNVKPLMMLDGTIKGQMKFSQGNLTGGEEEYKKALSHETGLDRDSRASFINAINAMQGSLLSIDKSEAKEIADYTVSLAEANVKLNPSDSMMQMQLALALNTAAAINGDDARKFSFYSDRALAAIDESIKASPGRVTIYFSKAQIYLARNEKDRAIETLKYAYGLNENYAEAACYLAKAAIYLEEQDVGYSALDKCLDLSGSAYLNPIDLIKIAINHYNEKKDLPHMLILYERWTDMEPSNVKVWVNLSLLYEQVGKKDQAINAAKKAMELDASLKQSAEEFIWKLEGK